MDTMREAPLYSVSIWSLMQDTAWSTFATLPLAKAKARRVISASGLTQQLHGGRKENKTHVSLVNYIISSLSYRFLFERVYQVSCMSLSLKKVYFLYQIKQCCAHQNIK